jgi:hypothetical protein
MKINLLFPNYHHMEYNLDLTDVFEIVIPSYIHKWFKKLLNNIEKYNFDFSADSCWMTLLRPSLLLMKDSNSEWNQISENIMNSLEKHWKTSSDKLFGVNDLILCIEMLCEQTPQSIWNTLDETIATTHTINDFLPYVITAKQMEFFKKFQNTSIDTFSVQNNWRLLFSCWESAISVSTHLTRLYIIISNYDNHFPKSYSNIQRLCAEFESNFLQKFQRFLPLLIDKSEYVKTNNGFIRYKILALCTHSSNSIVSTFSGKIGQIISENKIYNLQSLIQTFNCIETDVKQFVKYSKELIDTFDPIKTCEQNVKKLTLKKYKYLRSLDNIGFVTTSLIIVLSQIQTNNVNYDTCQDILSKLCVLRDKIVLILEQLFKNGFLFAHIDKIINFKDDIFMNYFLTYDKWEKQKWSLHLLSAVFLIFWKIKNKVESHFDFFFNLIKINV